MEPDDEHAVHVRARMIGLGVWLTHALSPTMGPGRRAALLPILFAALAYPLRRVVLAYVALAPVGLFATSLALAGVMCAWQARLQRESRTELARALRTDPLTGCLNRRGVAARVAAELATAEPFALLPHADRDLHERKRAQRAERVVA